MANARLKAIKLLFPQNTPQEREWFNYFKNLFNQSSERGIILEPENPKGSLPLTSIQAESLSFPTVVLETDAKIRLRIGCLEVVSSKCEAMPEKAKREPSPKDTFLPLEVVASKLQGRVTGVDHTGLNIPDRVVSREQWDAFIHSLAKITNIYKYPEEEWPFIIPATHEEFESDIADFVSGRTPRFEWVYDSYSAIPVLQFSLETTLNRAKAEALFPFPNGFGIPGLEDIFRTVFVKCPWEGLLIRIDLNYKRDTTNDWITGEWLIREGGRVRG